MSHTRHAARLLGLATLAALGLAAHPQAARAQAVPVSNADFETPNLPQDPGHGNYQYNPDPSQGWTFSGSSGIAGVGSAFGNQEAGDNTQVAFVQTNGGPPGSVSQLLSGFTPGDAYSVSFDSTQRGGGGAQMLTVSLFGQSYTLQPYGTDAYNTYTISDFVADGASGTLSFTGSVQSGDNTAFVDNVGVAPDAPAAIVNGGFTSPDIGGSSGSGNYSYGSYGAPNTLGEWVYRANAGQVSGAGNPFSPTLPAGEQAAFIQGHGSVSQLVAGFQTGQSYTLSFDASRRGGGSGPNDFEVALDPTFNSDGTLASAGTVLGTYTPNDPGAFDPFSTNAFTATPGDHTLAFIGLDSVNGVPGGDLSSDVTNVRLSSVAAAPEPSQTAALGLGLLGLAGLALKARKRTA